MGTLHVQRGQLKEQPAEVRAYGAAVFMHNGSCIQQRHHSVLSSQGRTLIPASISSAKRSAQKPGRSMARAQAGSSVSFAVCASLTACTWQIVTLAARCRYRRVPCLPAAELRLSCAGSGTRTEFEASQPGSSHSWAQNSQHGRLRAARRLQLSCADRQGASTGSDVPPGAATGPAWPTWPHLRGPKQRGCMPRSGPPAPSLHPQHVSDQRAHTWNGR